MKIYLVIAAIGLASAAQAGGPVAAVEEPAPMAPAAMAPANDWTGFYVGFHATQGSIDDTTINPDSSGYGVQGGYLRDLGTFVAGAELSYSKGGLEGIFTGFDVAATRLKLIGGYDAGKIMPYAFVGATRYEVSLGTSSNSDTMANYGVGAKLALGASGKARVGLEYVMEKTDKFGLSPNKLDSRELSLRLDYRF